MEDGGRAPGRVDVDGNLELPPGFRFHPTDEELITHYLSRKVVDGGFVARAIGDVDLNKIEPWELPWKAKMGEKEWYFFAVRDRKYPTGLRTNRATGAGYWKATGKDKEIKRGSSLVGMKKTLVFYRGRAPKGEKTNWVMHEYRLDGRISRYNLPRTAKDEWVICRIFQKSISIAVGPGGAGGSGGAVGGGKKLAGFTRMESSSYSNDLTVLDIAAGSFTRTPMPSTVDHMQIASPAASGAAHVTCFSNSMEGYAGYFAGDHLYTNSAYPTSEISCSPLISMNNQPPVTDQLLGHLRLSGSTGLVQILQSNSYGIKERCKGEEVGGYSLSQETGLTSDRNPEISSPALPKRELYRLPFAVQGVSSVPPLMDDIWNY